MMEEDVKIKEETKKLLSLYQENSALYLKLGRALLPSRERDIVLEKTAEAGMWLRMIIDMLHPISVDQAKIHSANVKELPQ